MGARRAPWAPRAAASALLPPPRGTGWVQSGRPSAQARRVGGGAREVRAGAAPSPKRFLGFGAPTAFLTGIGVWVWDEPGVQACSVFQGLRPGSASVLSFLCLEVSLQTARQGGHLRKAKIFRSRKRPRICIGPLGPAASSSLRRKRNCSPVLDWGWGWTVDGEEARDASSRIR